ncbi:hypothetical protein Tco_0034553, partial [Tanacetum coccineum]
LPICVSSLWGKCVPLSLSGCSEPSGAYHAVEVNIRGLLELDKSNLSVVASDLTCPLTSQLLQSISLVLACASLAAISKLLSSSGSSGGDYTSSWE